MRVSARRSLRQAVALAGAAVLVVAAAASPAAATPGQRGAHAALQALAPPGLFTWGDALFGELGNGEDGGIPGLGGTLIEEDSPGSVSLPGTVAQLSADGDDGAALLANGTVATWGYNPYGQIGDGTTADRTTPFVVPGLTGITQIANGGNHMLALDSSGNVWSWGANQDGEVGNSASGPAVPTPMQVLTGVLQVAAGAYASYALRSDGTVWAWGYNNLGELGDGTTTTRLLPERVPGLTGITKISAGFESAYAIRADGSVLAWGDNTHGELGIGTSGGSSLTPLPVPGLTGVTQISAASGTVLALAGPAGTVWAWGVNAFGSLGDGTTSPHYTPEQTGLSGVRQVSTGGNHSAAVLSNGSLMTWGDNLTGELGTGPVDNNPHPSPLLVRTLAGATQVSAGIYFTTAVASPAPRVPSVIGYTQSEAAQALQAAGYVLGRVAVVVDITCEYIGEVKTQTPAAGTIDPPGISVSVTIGKAGGKCL
ncbi:MAG TPA: PASTA domain-containing protein [Streptosporangiaceae bacterium]